MDYHNRIINNELSQKDSIHFNDSLHYSTKAGRVVYGGGGIMPDVFVPVDTSGVNKLFTSIVRKNLVYYFAFEYADKNRSKLNKYSDVWELDRFLSESGLFDDFIKHVKEKGISVKKDELQESKKLIKTQLHAYVCRNILGDDGFYPIIFTIDKAVLKSVELLEKGDWSPNEIAKLDSFSN